MTFGLLTRRTDGVDILTPGVFTMRAVASFFGGGQDDRSAAIDVAHPAVRAGMVAVCTPGREYPMLIPPLIGSKKPSAVDYQLYSGGVMMPKAECRDGSVRLSPPILGGRFSSNVHVYVFEYL